MPILFTKGYGFANDTKQIIAVKKLKDTPLGKSGSETQLLLFLILYTSRSKCKINGSHVRNNFSICLLQYQFAQTWTHCQDCCQSGILHQLHISKI